jgi:hypothetical protein
MFGCHSAREGSAVASIADAMPGTPAIPRGVFRRLAWVPTCAGMTLALGLGTPSIAQENPAEIIAAHIRMQGYACDKALNAERNAKISKPNETVWMLQCSNGSYRVRLVPDMAAAVEQVKPDKSN